jgi:hypothetical protein
MREEEGPARDGEAAEDTVCLGRPRAAAAQDRRVERLARRAASWSAWYEGEIML